MTNQNHVTNGIPHGYTSLTPYFAVEDPRGALAFYQEVFGARVVAVTEFGDTIAHAELDFGNGRLQLGSPQPDYHLVAAPTGEDTCFSYVFYCADADAVVAKAVQHGATVREPLNTFVSGDRFASLRDPYGIRWNVMTRVEDISEEESNARIAAWAATQG